MRGQSWEEYLEVPTTLFGKNTIKVLLFCVWCIKRKTYTINKGHVVSHDLCFLKFLRWSTLNFFYNCSWRMTISIRCCYKSTCNSTPSDSLHYFLISYLPFGYIILWENCLLERHRFGGVWHTPGDLPYEETWEEHDNVLGSW